MEFIEISGKTVEDAITEATVKLGATSDEIEYEVVQEGSNGFLGIGSKPAIIKVKKKDSIDDFIKEFLGKIFESMELKVDIVITKSENDKVLDIDLRGDDMGVLIGKRGQTLDSLQYLASLAVTKETGKYVKVKLDTENYRERRKETLENLAKNIATKVKKFRKQVALEPMNPYERRIIHSALQNDKYVETFSEGEEPFRKVIIAPKKGVVYEDRRRGNGRYGNKRFDSGRNNKKVSSSREFHKRYGADTKDYSTDYKKDYADYLESKAAAKAAAEAQAKAEASKE